MILTAMIFMDTCFNTQPPEGGWKIVDMAVSEICCFNTQPPEGGWGLILLKAKRL